MTPNEVASPALFAKFIHKDMLMSGSPQNTTKMYDSSIQKSSKHNSTVKKVKKRTESDDDEDCIGFMCGENNDVMGKKRRYNEKKDNENYEEISGSDADSKFYRGKNWTKKSLANKKSEYMRDQFDKTASPTHYKYRRGCKKTMESVVKDITQFEGYDILRLVGIKQVKQADSRSLGHVVTVEWAPREGKPPIEKSILTYEDVRKNAPKQLCDFYIARTTFKKPD